MFRIIKTLRINFSTLIHTFKIIHRNTYNPETSKVDIPGAEKYFNDLTVR